MELELNRIFIRILFTVFRTHTSKEKNKTRNHTHTRMERLSVGGLQCVEPVVDLYHHIPEDKADTVFAREITRTALLIESGDLDAHPDTHRWCLSLGMSARQTPPLIMKTVYLRLRECHDLLALCSGAGDEGLRHALRIFSNAHLDLMDELLSAACNGMWRELEDDEDMFGTGGLVHVFPPLAENAPSQENMPDLMSCAYLTQFLYTKPVQSITAMQQIMHIIFYKALNHKCFSRKLSSVTLDDILKSPEIEELLRVVVQSSLLGVYRHCEVFPDFGTRLAIRSFMRRESCMGVFAGWIKRFGALFRYTTREVLIYYVSNIGVEQFLEERFSWHTNSKPILHIVDKMRRALSSVIPDVLGDGTSEVWREFYCKNNSEQWNVMANRMFSAASDVIREEHSGTMCYNIVPYAGDWIYMFSEALCKIGLMMMIQSRTSPLNYHAYVHHIVAKRGLDEATVERILECAADCEIMLGLGGDGNYEMTARWFALLGMSEETIDLLRGLHRIYLDDTITKNKLHEFIRGYFVKPLSEKSKNKNKKQKKKRRRRTKKLKLEKTRSYDLYVMCAVFLCVQGRQQTLVVELPPHIREMQRDAVRYHHEINEWEERGCERERELATLFYCKRCEQWKNEVIGVPPLGATEKNNIDIMNDQSLSIGDKYDRFESMRRSIGPRKISRNNATGVYQCNHSLNSASERKRRARTFLLRNKLAVGHEDAYADVMMNEIQRMHENPENVYDTEVLACMNMIQHCSYPLSTTTLIGKVMRLGGQLYSLCVRCGQLTYYAAFAPSVDNLLGLTCVVCCRRMPRSTLGTGLVVIPEHSLSTMIPYAKRIEPTSGVSDQEKLDKMLYTRAECRRMCVYCENNLAGISFQKSRLVYVYMQERDARVTPILLCEKHWYRVPYHMRLRKVWVYAELIQNIQSNWTRSIFAARLPKLQKHR